MRFTIGPLVSGTGMILLSAAAVFLVAGIILLIKNLRTDWNMTVSSFNQKFAYESSLGKSDMQQDTKRREIARQMGIHSASPTDEQENSTDPQETEIMNENQPSTERQTLMLIGNGDVTEEL